MNKLLGLLCVLLSACHDITGLGQATAYNDPAFLRPLWVQLQQCSGLRGDFDAVRFETTPNLTTDGRETLGIWLPTGNRIVVVERLENDPRIWRHEMMHALLHGGSDHPAKYFNGVCGYLP